MSNDQFPHRPNGGDAAVPAGDPHQPAQPAAHDVTKKEAAEAQEILSLDQPLAQSQTPPSLPAESGPTAFNLPPTMSGPSEITGLQNPMHEAAGQGGFLAHDGFNAPKVDEPAVQAQTGPADPYLSNAPAAQASPYGHPAGFGTSAPVAPEASDAEKAGAGLDPEKPYGAPVPPVFGQQEEDAPAASPASAEVPSSEDSGEKSAPSAPVFGEPAPSTSTYGDQVPAQPEAPQYGSSAPTPYGAPAAPTYAPTDPNAYGQPQQPNYGQSGDQYGYAAAAGASAYGQSSYPGQQSQAPAAYGQQSYSQVQGYEDQSARSSASMSHWGPIVANVLSLGWLGWVVPLVVLNGQGKTNAFVGHHARQSLNLELTFLIINVLTGWMILIGLPIAGIAGLAVLVVQILAAVKANNGERFPIPAIPFTKDPS